MKPSVSELRHCFEGAIPSVIATCACDGIPNVAYLSQVHYIDEQHLALTFQFFNTTHKNILENQRAVVQVVDPVSAAHYRIQLEYLRTETEGPLFENMKAKLAGIASHTGMSKVFRLLGSDVYRVVETECVFGDSSEPTGQRRHLLHGLRTCLSDIAACTDLATLFDDTLDGLQRHCGMTQVMLLMHDAASQRLYTVASRGYEQSGIGSEIAIGEGIIGVAARERTPIRISYAAQEYLYSLAMRERFEKCADSADLETEIPFPGLPGSGSQIAVPILHGDRLYAVLYAESQQEQRFTYEDEDVLVVLACQLGLTIGLLSQAAEPQAEPSATGVVSRSHGTPVTLKHFAADHSIFIVNDYLIKGVAGAIFWKLVHDYIEFGRNEFSNRELRLDPELKLPDITDNLEARLILLQRRLSERCSFISIEKTGRGRFRLNVGRPLNLANVQHR